MLNFIKENISNIIIILILSVAVIFIIKYIHKNKKAGKCIGCSSASTCPHSKCNKQ